MRLALLHLPIVHGDAGANRRHLLEQAECAADGGANLVLAPEMALSGYSFESPEEVARVAEPDDGPLARGMAAFTQRRSCYFCAGLPMRDPANGLFYNTALVYGPNGACVCRYRKVSNERAWASPGAPDQAAFFDTPWGRVGVLICSDTYYNILPRLQALRGVQLLLTPANWPPSQGQQGESGLDPLALWSLRAREHGFVLAACNRTGLDRKMDCRAATSAVFAADGMVLSQCRGTDSIILFCDLQVAQRRETLPVMSCLHAVKVPPLPETGMLTISASRREDVDLCLFPTRRAMEARLATKTCLLRTETLSLYDIGSARVALVEPDALCYPEFVLLLAAWQCDLAVAVGEVEDAALMGARCMDGLAIVLHTPARTLMTIPPQGHGRWTEHVREGDGAWRLELDTSKTRYKGVLQRVAPADIGDLLMREGRHEP